MNWSKLPNIQWLIENDGNIELGRVGPVACAAVASDEYTMLAALVRRDGESLDALLVRLEDALDDALNHEIFTDEINGGARMRFRLPARAQAPLGHALPEALLRNAARPSLGTRAKHGDAIIRRLTCRAAATASPERMHPTS